MLSCCYSTILWYVGAALLVVHLYKWGWWILSTVMITVDRYTAPVIKYQITQVDQELNPKKKVDTLGPRISGQPDQIQCYNKATLAALGTVPVVQPEQVKAIVARARVAQAKWAKTSFSTRRKFLFSLLNYVLEHQEEICRAGCIETGKTMLDGNLGEIITTCEKLRWTCAQGEDVLRTEVRDVGLITMHKWAEVQYLPIGVVGAIVSWNYPFHNILGPIISALFAGNAFVGKCSEYSSFFAKDWQAILREGISKLGQDPDLVTIVTGFPATGEALVESVDKLTFIGSPGVGKLVMEKASKTLTPVVLELGGKDPAIVFDDADLAQAIPTLMRGTFQNCGQNCVGLERLIVHEKIYDKVVAELEKRVKGLTQGPPCVTVDGSGEVPMCDTGAMTMGPASIKKIQELVDSSAAKGARVLVGGKATSSSFFPPTLIVDITNEMPIANEEVFGPVMAVYKFKNDQHAIDIVNGIPYGLGSNMFIGDVSRGREIAKKLQCGMCNINDFAINYLCQSMPFGGCKISGFDRFAGIEGLRGNCLLRSQTSDRIPGVKTTIPPLLDYPMKKQSFPFVETLNKILFGTVPQFVMGIAKIISINGEAAKNKNQ